jgi:hypothetical protein
VILVMAITFFLPIRVIFFFKKNEEVIWYVHLSTYLLKFGKRGPLSIFGLFGIFFDLN